MGLVTDPGFEAGGSWTLAGGATREADVGAFEGAYLCKLSSSAGLTQTATATSATVRLATGRSYVVLARLQRKSATNTNDRLHVQMDRGDGSYATLETIQSGATDIQQDIWTPKRYTFTALGANGSVRLFADYASGLDVTASNWWADMVRVFDATFGGAKLAQRAIDATIALLNSDLAAYLQDQDLLWNDSIKLTAPASSAIFDYERAETAGPKVQIAVFEETAYLLTDPYIDQQAGRAIYELPLLIRVTYSAELAKGPSEFMKRLRRYAAAIRDLIHAYQALGGTDDAIQSAVVSGIVPPRDLKPGEGEDLVVKGEIGIRLLVRCEESAL